jgi:hypothetical protein
MKQSKVREPKNSNSPEIRKELIIAGIGLFGTIMAAFISNWENITKEKLIINTTQTADVKIATSPVAATQTNLVQITDTVTPKPEILWEELFSVVLSQNICNFTSEIIPEWFVPYLGSSDAIEKLEGTETWAFGPEVQRPASYFLDISNISNKTEWARISNTFQVTVSWIDNAPKHADVLLNTGGCGGGSYRSTDSTVSLSPEYLSTKQKISFSQYDYYSLQPGESEVFLYQVQCKGPGVYLMEASIPYTFTTDWNDIILVSPRYIVCPESFSSWIINPSGPSIALYKNFSWDTVTQSYIETP